MKNRHSIILFGPTAVGKTDISLALARKISGEIINMDVGQLYKPFSIGTAKPLDWEINEVRHHLFDIINKPIDYNAFVYRQEVGSVLESIWQRNKTPIIVGGSGFYLSSLLFEIITPSQNHQSLINVETMYPPETNWWDTLYQIDPERARAIDTHDLYRIKRALAIWHTHHIKPSESLMRYHPIAPSSIFFLERERSDLYNRINKRIYHMIDDGWIKEVQELCNTDWESFLVRKKLIGYDDLIHYIQQGDFSAESLHNVIAVIQQKTRNYAKRQITFAKMMQKKLSFAQICGKVHYNTPVTVHNVPMTLASIDDCVTMIANILP